MTKKRHGRKSASHLHNIPPERRKAVKRMGGGRPSPSDQKQMEAALERIRKAPRGPEYSTNQIEQAASRYCRTKYPTCYICDLGRYCYERRNVWGSPMLLEGRQNDIAEVLKKRRYLM